MLTKVAIDELVATGCTMMQFMVTSEAPYICFYTNGKGFVMNESVVTYEGNDTYVASGATVQIDLLALQAFVTDEVGLKFVLTSTSGWAEYDADVDVIFSNFVFA